jgi:hypothetical protein
MMYAVCALQRKGSQPRSSNARAARTHAADAGDLQMKKRRREGEGNDGGDQLLVRMQHRRDGEQRHKEARAAARTPRMTHKGWLVHRLLSMVCMIEMHDRNDSDANRRVHKQPAATKMPGHTIGGSLTAVRQSFPTCAWHHW